jgi:hypothetical protein
MRLRRRLAYASPSVSNIAAFIASCARLAGPDHELERGEIALAGVEGAVDHVSHCADEAIMRFGSTSACGA